MRLLSVLWNSLRNDGFLKVREISNDVLFCIFSIFFIKNVVFFTLIGLGPNVITDGTFITFGSNSYYRWDLYCTGPFITHVPSTNVTVIAQKEYRVQLNLIK